MRARENTILVHEVLGMEPGASGMQVLYSTNYAISLATLLSLLTNNILNLSAKDPCMSFFCTLTSDVGHYW